MRLARGYPARTAPNSTVRDRVLWVAADLVVEMTDSLELQRRMGHIEMAGETVLQMVQDPSHLTSTDAVVSHDDMRSEYRQRRGQRPGVQIMDRGHFVQFE